MLTISMFYQKFKETVIKMIRQESIIHARNFISILLLVALIVFFGLALYYAVMTASQASYMQASLVDLDAGHKRVYDKYIEFTNVKGEVLNLSGSTQSIPSRDLPSGIPKEPFEKGVEKSQFHLDSVRQSYILAISEYGGVLCIAEDLIKKSVIFKDAPGIIAICDAWKTGVDPDGITTGHDKPDREVGVSLLRASLDQRVRLSISYILPVIFGILGACIFALRDLTDKDGFNFVELHRVLGYWIRICLGAICGLIIGYINIPTSSSTPGASPLLLSLVAGFSSDTVISLLRRIADALNYESTIQKASPDVEVKSGQDGEAAKAKEARAEQAI